MLKKPFVQLLLVAFLAAGFQEQMVGQDKPAMEELLLIPGVETDGSYPSVYRTRQILSEMNEEGRVEGDVLKTVYELGQFMETGIRDPEERLGYGVEFNKRLDTMTPAQFS